MTKRYEYPFLAAVEALRVAALTLVDDDAPADMRGLDGIEGERLHAEALAVGLALLARSGEGVGVEVLTGNERVDVLLTAGPVDADGCAGARSVSEAKARALRVLGWEVEAATPLRPIHTWRFYT